MAATTNEQLIQRLTDEISRGNVDVVDDLYAEDFVAHPLFYRPIAPPGAEHVSDRERMKAIIHMNQEFASGHTTIDKIVSAGDYVTAITSRVGTTKDGKALTGHAINVYRIADGKIAESWISFDRLGTFQQIGIVPETAELQRQAGMRP